MPVSKKKPTTLTSEVSTQESSSPVLPEQEDFRQYLRRLAVSAIQVLIEQVMCEELDESHRSPPLENVLPIAVGIAMVPTPAI